MRQWSSRKLQNLAHLVGAVNSLLLLLSGVFIGKGSFLYFFIIAFCYLFLTRLSSEIFYRILVRINEECAGGERDENKRK